MERNRIFFTLILTIIAVSAHAGSNNESHDAQVPELIQAAQSDDLDTVNRLISAGVDLEVRDNRRNTALMMAVQANHVNMAQVLIDAGANIEARNHKGSTPLMYATSAEAAQLLIAAGAKVNATNSSGWTALKSASQSGYMEVVNILLHTGADVHATGPFSLPALTYAVINEHTEVVDLLLQAGANVNMTAEFDGWNALMYASIHAYIDLVRTLIAAGTNLGSVTHRGKTVYSIASEWGHETICALLETAGKYRMAVSRQPTETLADALKECRYRKQMYDEIERQCNAALERRDQITSTDPRARALRQKIVHFAEQSKQRLFQAEAALKACQDLALQFVRRGAELSDATVAPLLKDNLFEKFHVKLIMLARSLQPTLAATTHDKQLVEQHRIFERLFGPDVSVRICKGALPRDDYRQLRALVAQRAQIANDLQQARQRSRTEQPVLQWRQRPIEQFRPILAALEADQPATSELSAAPRREPCIIL